MTTLEYMERQILKHRFNYQREFARAVPTEQLRNIEDKIRYYEEAVEALKILGGDYMNENMSVLESVENPVLVSKVQQAIRTIKAGICKRVDVTKEIKVYECGSIIRIDIKP